MKNTVYSKYTLEDKVMTVYIVYEHFTNDAECWDYVLKIFSDKTAAELYALDQEVNTCYGYSYSVKEAQVE